jgi:outer membrane receptor protein involved in Fe transport
MKKHQLKRSAIAIAVAGGLAAMPLQAQMLEEVIVTATKRAVGMQDVPIALSVMTGEKIAEAGIGNLEDMTVFMPNVHIAEGSSSDSLFIRGIGSGVNFGFEQSVGTFIDGIYFGRSQASKTAFLDLERVEVLKGSQSTLFGKNTIAGAINITTAKPTDEFEGSIAVSAEPEFGGKEGTLTLSGPITDNFGARFVYQDSSEDGYLDNAFLGQDETQRDHEVGRLTLAWQPSDDLDVTFKYEKGESESVGTNEVLTVLTDGSANPDLNALNIYGTVDPNIAQNSGFQNDRKSEATFQAPNRRGTAFLDSDWDIYTLTLEYALGEYSLKSITGYVDYEFQNSRDSDFSPIQGIGRGRDESHKQFTQEFLLTSPESDSFEWLAGVYYQDEELEHNRFTDISLRNIGQAFSDAGVPLPVGAVADGSALLANAAPGSALDLDATAHNTFNQDSETLSAFFQGTFHLNDTLRVIAGVRYSEDKKEFDKDARFGDFLSNPTDPVSDNAGTLAAVYDELLAFATVHNFTNGSAEVCRGIEDGGLANLTIPATCTTSALNTEREEDHVTGDITVQWDFSDETMLYAKYGTGYKAGGFDENNSLANLSAQEFEDEQSATIEFGAKMNLWEGRGRLNIAIFHSEFEDVQVSTFDGTAGFIVGNAAESEVDGIELDGQYAVSDELTLTGAIAYLDANYDSFTDAACTAQQAIDLADAGGDRASCVQDLSGEPLQFAADISASFGARHLTEITDDLELGLSLDVQYSGDYDTAADNDPVLEQEAFTKVNARISLADINGSWSVALLGKNLTDKTTSSWGNDVPLGSLGFDNSYFQVLDAPRSYEIQATYNF